MKKFKIIISIILTAAILFAAATSNTASAIGTDACVTVVGSEDYTPISDNLFGVFFEDINYAADGGLSSNLIRNNSFEQKLAWADDTYDCRMTGWEVTEGEAVLLQDSPLNENNPSYLHADTDSVVRNYGYPDTDETYGILLDKSESYDLSFYIRGGSVKYTFVTEDGKSVFSGELTGGNEFTKATAVIKPSEKAYTALEITIPAGTDVDFFNLVSHSSFGYGQSPWTYSTLRPDLVKALKDLNPSFMRFPGGCLTEGAYRWEYAYNWKDTIGAPEERVQIPNIWGYNQSMSIGFYEYFCLCEYLGATPVPVLHAGLMCQSRGSWTMDIDSEEFAQHIQDILDLIEYANGGTDTEWGAVRASNGHPEPFNMKYIAIGNENWMEDYWERFDIIYKAIKAAYPDITVISSAGAWADGKEYDYAWQQIDENYRDTVVDEHYYVGPGWVVDNYNRYDNYDRSSAKVFVGEYAVHRGGGDQITKNNLQVAIQEAIHMTSLVRNGDVVEMACYAPLFAREGYTQWAPNLIWYNSDQVVRTPSYYVQQLYMNNTGTAVVQSNLSGDGTDDIYQVVSINEKTKQIYVTVVNSSSDTKNIKVKLNGFDNLDPVAEQRYIGSGLYNLSNRFGTFNNVVAPKYQKVSVIGNTVTKAVAPHSLNIFCLSYGGENTYAGTGSATGYDMGNQIQTYFYEYLADFIAWFTQTGLYQFISGKISG